MQVHIFVKPQTSTNHWHNILIDLNCGNWNIETTGQECFAAKRRHWSILPWSCGRGQRWRLGLGLGPNVRWPGQVPILWAAEWNVQACRESFCRHPSTGQWFSKIPACWLGWRWCGWFGSISGALFALLQARPLSSFLLKMRLVCDLQHDD